MKRTITGRATARTMSLGELRQFVASIESLPDEAQVKARTSFRRHVRTVTVEEEDVGFDDYVRAVGNTGKDADKVKATDADQSGRGDRPKATEKAPA